MDSKKLNIELKVREKCYRTCAPGERLRFAALEVIRQAESEGCDNIDTATASAYCDGELRQSRLRRPVCAMVATIVMYDETGELVADAALYNPAR